MPRSGIQISLLNPKGPFFSFTPRSTLYREYCALFVCPSRFWMTPKSEFWPDAIAMILLVSGSYYSLGEPREVQKVGFDHTL